MNISQGFDMLFDTSHCILFDMKEFSWFKLVNYFCSSSVCAVVTLLHVYVSVLCVESLCDRLVCIRPHAVRLKRQKPPCKASPLQYYPKPGSSSKGCFLFFECHIICRMYGGAPITQAHYALKTKEYEIMHPVS